MNWNEKQLEDYAVENWDQVFNCVDPGRKSTVIGRQIPCRHGIIDLLAYRGEALYIVEFKAVKADDTVAGQLQRYRRAVEGLFYPDAVTLGMIAALEAGRITQTIVVAPSFTKRAMYGVDFCIRAFPVIDIEGKESAGFGFEPAHYCGTTKNTDAQLQEALTPYFRSVLQTEQTKLSRRNDATLRYSAEQRTKETN